MSLKSSDVGSTAQETELMCRWSRKKLGNCTGDGSRKTILPEKSDPALKSDACSGEALKVAPESTSILSTLALRKLFQKPEFSVLDGLNEYDDDFTYFTPRGELITHEMQRATGELVDRIANADEVQMTKWCDDQVNSAFASNKNAESLEDREVSGKA